MLDENLDILPAVGGAVEDLLRPDQDEIEDMLINADSRQVTDFLETPTPDPRNIYRPTPPLYRPQNHLYRFFIDGSLRTYYLATGIEGNRSFPIELAQIGAAVMQRDDGGNVRPLGTRQRILLLLPRGELGVSDTLWQALKKLDTPDGYFEVIDTTEKNATTPGEATIENLRTRAGGIARNRMHKLEIQVIDVTDGLRGEETWLILDGAVKLDEFIKTPFMIGVAKNFRKDPEFLFGRRRGARKDITSILAGLPYACRTVAFSAHGGKVAFWYVRLREQKQVDYPLMGVVKVELPTPDQKPVDADLIDLLSRALVAERNVTPYGRDARWHCHLYPIFLAEQTIKTGFYSKDVLMGMIRWPRSLQQALSQLAV
ncbi:MAG TPA: hypothetical protein DEP84_12140 [Chloroflexi bacterium]|nr:hypothetical protein [Chloroflexota bacterium]